MTNGQMGSLQSTSAMLMPKTSFKTSEHHSFGRDTAPRSWNICVATMHDVHAMICAVALKQLAEDGMRWGIW